MIRREMKHWNPGAPLSTVIDMVVREWALENGVSEIVARTVQLGGALEWSTNFEASDEMLALARRRPGAALISEWRGLTDEENSDGSGFMGWPEDNRALLAADALAEDMAKLKARADAFSLPDSEIPARILALEEWRRCHEREALIEHQKASDGQNGLSELQANTWRRLMALEARVSLHVAPAFDGAEADSGAEG